MSKQTKNQAYGLQWAIAHFLESVAGTSAHTDLHIDFTEFFEVLMGTSEADDPEFRERAILMLRFTKSFADHFACIDWRLMSSEAERMKHKYALKMLPKDEL